VALLAGAAGAGVVLALLPAAIARSPRSLVRVNVAGREVPAALGVVLCIAAGITAAGVLTLDYAHWDAASNERTTLAVLLLVVVTGGAGLLDDLRGDEASRGFRGHLSAAAQGRITGGLVKIMLVGFAALAAGWLVGGGRFVVECAAAVALTANLVNLLDRAPGRALKVMLLAALPLVFVAPGAWNVAAGGMLGGAAASLPADLSERAMLGDAGSNATGAVLGLGLALAASEVVLVVAILILAGLNLASEKWSFSEAITRTRALSAIDSLGRRQNDGK
jgi:UDP-N-acetylmuramyl pentapeptide phosphotransferase/UDP-N-acetylglucosamine-1-phosphate transferase